MSNLNWLGPGKGKLIECPECHKISLKKEVFKPMGTPNYPGEVDYFRLNEVIEYICNECGFKDRIRNG